MKANFVGVSFDKLQCKCCFICLDLVAGDTCLLLQSDIKLALDSLKAALLLIIKANAFLF